MKWLAAIVLMTVLAGCGGDDGGEPPVDAGESSTTAGSTAAPAASDAQETFVRLTAEHLCNVQSSVFEDPADLAAAYEQAPEYPGLTAEQVAEFEKKVLEDPEFSAELLDALATACG